MKQAIANLDKAFELFEREDNTEYWLVNLIKLINMHRVHVTPIGVPHRWCGIYDLIHIMNRPFEVPEEKVNKHVASYAYLEWLGYEAPDKGFRYGLAVNKMAHIVLHLQDQIELYSEYDFMHLWCPDMVEVTHL